MAKSVIMKNFKNDLYNYETTPPEGLWGNIVRELDTEKAIRIPGLRRKSKFLFYGLTAAASLVIIFISTFFFNRNKEAKLVVGTAAFQALSQKVKDSIVLNHQILESIINTPPDQKLIASTYDKQYGQSKKYITIEGPEGQPVKISVKAATLILSADDEFPPKPVWNKKIDKWKQIMLSNTMPPTSANLVDILLLAAHTENVE